MTMIRRSFVVVVVVLLSLVAFVVESMEEETRNIENENPSVAHAIKKPHVLSKTHSKDHEAIMEELEHQMQEEDEGNEDEEEDVESFQCTLTGAGGKDSCDAATDDDGSKCVWCILNNFGFCVSGTQAQQFEQVLPTIDCDDKNGNDDDKTAADDDKTPDTDDAVFSCLESTDEAACNANKDKKCVWCNTKGGFGVCLSPNAADDASESYWFDCPSEEEEEEAEELEEMEDRYFGDNGGRSGDEGGDDDYDDEEEEEELEDMEDYLEGEDEADDDDDYDEEEGDDDDQEEGEDDDEPDMHEFVVDTTCVLSAMLLDPADEEATSEAACFQARDINGNPCEWCAVAGSPFRLCLSEPQAQVAEYVGAVCTGSDESFEPEDFDDSCISHQFNDKNLSKEGCWANMDLDGNSCEWCNIMGVEMCLGGVQAELVEHWGATCVLDDAEYAMAQTAIEQHLEYLKAQKDQETINKLAKKTAEMGVVNPEDKPERPIEHKEEEEDEDEIDISTLWLTSDPSCMVTTLRTTNGHDEELACAQTQDAEGNACNWCQLGTSFYMCLNDEQADVAEYMGIECETISAETQDILKDHAQRASKYQDSGDDDDDDRMNDLEDFDPSCIMSMQNGPDQTACVNTKDQDGQACEWCSWNQYSLCLAAEQAEMIEPFGVKCDQVKPREPAKDLPASAILTELTSQMDTSCLIDAGLANDPAKCTESKDAITGKPCEWCTLGSLGVNACLSAEQAEQSRPLGVTCTTGDGEGILKSLPRDFWSCLSQSQSVDQCDETCTWCDLKGSPTNAGLCLSDAAADAIADNWPNGILECTEEPEAIPAGEEEGEAEEGEQQEEKQDSEQADDYDDDRAEGGQDDDDDDDGADVYDDDAKEGEGEGDGTEQVA